MRDYEKPAWRGSYIVSQETETRLQKTIVPNTHSAWLVLRQARDGSWKPIGKIWRHDLYWYGELYDVAGDVIRATFPVSGTRRRSDAEMSINRSRLFYELDNRIVPDRYCEEI